MRNPLKNNTLVILIIFLSIITFSLKNLYAEQYNESTVRYIMLDISLGGPISFYRNANDANSIEAVARWDKGIRIQNYSSFERKDLGGDLGWTVVYKNTTQRVPGMIAWLSNEAYNESTVRYIMLDISLGGPISFYRNANDANSIEAVARWEKGIRIQNYSSFERKDLGGDLGWTIVYKNTTQRVPGMIAWLESPLSAQFPYQDLVSYFSFDQDPTDDFGNNDLINHNAKMVVGKIGNCYEFNKTNYLGTSNNVSFNRGREEYSISVWFHPDTVTGTSSYIILDRNTENTYFSYGLEILPTHELRFSSWSSTYLEIRGIYINYGKWYHVVVTVGTKEAKLYLNGILQATKSVLISETPGSGLTIGGYYGAYGFEKANFFEGKIDEIGIWNRVLTNQEVNNLYNNGEGLSYSQLTAISEPSATEIATNFILSQNYPNPFNPSTTISFALPTSSKVVVDIYNSLGQKVTRLLENQMSAGKHQVKFEAGDLPTGVYYYRIQAGKFSTVKKMLLIR